ncbi:MAG TPA: ABC transporter permease [Gammaproteobacteria bacterium]|nr:ABC transporter permease [Gammaproteobacteria bacterium]
MLDSSFLDALGLIATANADLYEILWLSVQVSITALLVSVILGFPLGTTLAISDFRGKQLCTTVLNALMGLPPVVVGLLVYLALSRTGPFGVLGLLYTPTAMVIAQVVLITPIIAALTYQVMDDLHREYRELFFSLNIQLPKAVSAYLWDARYSLITTLLAGFGRAISEVGAVMIVGGNIDHLTRVMTTAIALETSKGELAIALALGVVLLALALIVNGLVTAVRTRASRYGYT